MDPVPDSAARAADHALPAERWARFVADHWEARPVVWRRPFATPLVSAAQLFAALVRACAQYVAEGRTAGVPQDRSNAVRVNVGGAALMVDVERHLPHDGDGSLAGYAARMERQLAGRPYELIVHQLQAFDAAMWERMRQFLAGLYDLVGLPAEKAEAVVFLRNHVATSFGLHQDHASIFMFVIEGKKRMLTWPDHVFRGQEGKFASLDYDAYRDQATVLEGGPGDVVYWPSNAWHVGEASGGLSASISLGLRLKHPPVADVVNLAIGLLRPHAVPVDLYAADAQRGAAVPAALAQALASMRALCDSGELERAVRLHWLKRVTGGGFTRVPPPAPIEPVADDDLVTGRSRTPILRITWADGCDMLSASGHAIPAPATPGVRTLIERLNASRSERVGDLVGDCSSTGVDDAAFLRRLLAQLWALRAIDVVRPPAGVP